MTGRDREDDAILATDVFALYPIPGGPTVAALRGLSLRVPTGERLVVHGPNGSGKTTLLRLLGGELPPSSGQLSVAGHELSLPDRRTAGRLRRDVLGVVAQNSGRALRPELSVLDNVALQLRLAGRSQHTARTQAGEVLDVLGMAGYAPRRPATLSGGEAQRVAVCAAVAHRPRVVLADEPTGELDAASADLVYDLLAASADHVGATLVLVTHDVHAARIASRVVRIRDGRLSEQWDPAHPADEQLVLDPAGWLRLPEGLRAQAGTAVRVGERDGAIELRGTGRPHAAPSAPPALPGPLAADAVSSPLARLRGVSVRLGGQPVLDRLELEVAPGTVTVIRGRSGSGKSTLLRLLLGLADPDEGTVELAGQALSRLDRAERADLRRRYAGVSTQSGALVETADARENIVLARRTRGLAITGRECSDVVDALLAALDLAALAGRPARLLSGGERQRVAIARSIAVQRALVVVDEPTSQQDERHAAGTAAALAAAAAAGTAVVCATHDDVLVAVADVVVDLA